MAELVVALADNESAPRTRRPPDARAIPVPFAYAPSDDGTDENLLVLLHGLGDTHLPFARLARELRLPQTATLALRAPQQLPYIDEPAFQWYPAFDALGEPLAHPDPTPAVQLLRTVLAALDWPTQRVHLFGFGQGGTAALELALALSAPLGSAVAVSGPLLSFPATPTHRATPVLALGPPQPALHRAFDSVRVQRAPPGERMPASRGEWEPVMRFWSERLARRQGEGLYEVLSGMGSPA